MTDIKLLSSVIEQSGLRRDYIAEKLGISRQTFSYKCNGKIDFTAKEIQGLCVLLKITSLEEKERIFFAEKVHINVD